MYRLDRPPFSIIRCRFHWLGRSSLSIISPPRFHELPRCPNCSEVNEVLAFAYGGYRLPFLTTRILFSRLEGIAESSTSFREAEGNFCRVENNLRQYPVYYAFYMVLGTCNKRRGLCLLDKHERYRVTAAQWTSCCFWSGETARTDCEPAVSQGGSMSISSINSSTVLQWLQSSLSMAGLTVGNQSSSASCESQSGSNAISPFQQALQMLTSQTAQPTDPQQSLSVNGAQGTHHHHHYRHSGGEGNNQGNASFIDQLAQSIVSDLQQTDSTGTASTTNSSSASSGNGLSFIDGLASAIANDLLAKYQQTTDSSPAPSPSTQVNAVA